MPTAKCKISSRSSGLEIRFALKEALEEKATNESHFWAFPACSVSQSPTPAPSLKAGARPSTPFAPSTSLSIKPLRFLSPGSSRRSPSSTFARVRWSMRREFNDLEIFAGALIAFFCFWGFVYLVFILPEFLGGLL